MIRLPVIAASAALCGCTSTSSVGIATENLYADYEATRHGDRVATQATFHVGNGNIGTYVRLDGDDLVSCNATPLAAMDTIADQVWYEAELPAVATPFVFELRRMGQAIDTPVAAPAPIMLAAPASTTLSGSQSMAITWSPSGSSDPITVAIDVTHGSCVSAVVATVPDTGSAIVSGTQVAPTDGSSCTATLVVTRSSETTVASPFQGNRLVSASYDSIGITVEP